MLRPRWRKVLADLWANKARTALVVASIAVGVFAIGTIAATYVIISDDMMASYLGTNPPNIELRVSPLQLDDLETARRTVGVLEAEGRRHVAVRVWDDAGDWKRLTLVAVPEFGEMRINTLVPLAGAPVPGDQQLLLERKTAQGLGVSVGDTLQIELSDGTSRPMPVMGIAQDPSAGYDAILGEMKAYVTFDTLEWLHATPTLDRLLATVADHPNNRAHIDRVATQLTDRMERAGHVVHLTSISRRDDHPLKAIIQALLGVLAFMGVLIAFLSGSLIANTMSALLNQHLRQIGVMKLVGARRVQVVGMYLALIMTFGLVAFALAIPAASWAAYALSEFVADLINFYTVGFRVVPLALLMQGLVALCVPPLAGMMPVLSGSRTSVKEALTAVGLSGGGKGRRELSSGLRPPRWLSRPLLISIRNTFRRKRRLLLTLFTLTLGGAVFISVFNVQIALNNKVLQLTRYFLADVNLEFAQPYRVEVVEAEALRVPGVERVEVWASARGELIRGDGSNPENVSILAPPSGSTLLVPVLTKGRWLLPGDQNALTVNEVFLEEFPGVGPGDRLRLKVAGREDDWVVVGIFQYGAMDEMLAYANHDYLTGLLGTRSRSAVYRIVTADHSLAVQQQAARLLDQHFRGRGLDVSRAEAGSAMGAHITDLMGILTTVLLVMALLTALVGSIGLAGTMGMNVMERTREIGVLRAIGAHDRIIAKLVVVEGLLIGLISYVLGAVLSFPITRLLSDVISVAIFKGPADFGFTSRGFVLWLGVVLLLSAAASLAPARGASRLTIREVLAYE